MSRTVCGICWCPYDDDTGACACPPPSVQKSTLREAAQQALEALEYGQHTLEQVSKNQWQSRGVLAMEALKAALAEPVQEPVAWRTFDGEGGYDYRTYEDNENHAAEWAQRNPHHVGWVEPLYTAPPQRKPPTNQCGETCERAKLCAVCARGLADGDNLSPTEPVQEPQLKRIHPLDMPLEVFVEDLSTRPRNIINAEMGYFTHLGDEYIKPPLTVRHLLMFSRKEMRKWPNLGKRSLNEIEEMLRNRGLHLWDEHDERSLRLLREHPTYFRAVPSGVQE